MKEQLMADDLGFPKSRDYRITLSCKAVTCYLNNSNTCSAPSIVVIGIRGKCEEFKERGD